MKTSTRSRFCLRWAFAASFSLAALAGCQDAKPELGPGDVRTLRVLAVQSEPADPVPGKPALLRAIVLNPTPDKVGLVWAAVDPSTVLASEGARGELDPRALGFAGLVTPPVVLPAAASPSFPFAATAAYVPAVSAPGEVTSVAVVLLARTGELDIGRALDPERQAAYFKQLLAEAVPAVKILRLNDDPPNENPRILSVEALRRVYEIDETSNKVTKGTPLGKFDIPPGATLEMRANVEDESPLCESEERKDYGKRGTSCVSFSWYATTGLFHGFVRAAEPWTAPYEAGIYTIVVVARDRIGGLDWYIQDVNVGRSVAPGKAGRVLLRSVNAEPKTTPAARLYWLPVDDPALMADLRAKAGSSEVFTAAVTVRPDMSERLGLTIDPASFRLVGGPQHTTSLQAAAEHEIAAEIHVKLTIEALDE